MIQLRQHELTNITSTPAPALPPRPSMSPIHVSTPSIPSSSPSFSFTSMSPIPNPPTVNQPNTQPPATQTAKETNTDPDSNSNSNSLFSPSQGPALTAIIDTVLVLVLITFLTVCFLQWRSGNRVRRQKRRREDLERECRECRDHHRENGYGYGYAGPSYLVEVPLEEDLRSGVEVERADYHHRYGDGDGDGDGGRLDGNDTCTAETGSSLGGGIERCERHGDGHGDGDVKGPYRFEEVRVGR